ncbi:GNAT family N-acetyltransferase [Parendozoicomonas sp. Alg238-R29]|uniref:GNAT family N-acetyltransferase n=1 Tax=Parendozoicomonas sp. Alg238-R29 TaxID=2993446 RepID=UPI00248D3F79|nr:GNAT family N-acetyltransferase [Parendozoicomonas sp. Alg238-R29]
MRANVGFTIPVANSGAVTLGLLSTYLLEAHRGDDRLCIELAKAEPSTQLTVTLARGSSKPSSETSVLLASLTDYLFSRSQILDELILNSDLLNHLHQHCLADGLITRLDAKGFGIIDRAAFYQNGLLWHWRGNRNPVTETWETNDKGVKHPLRQEQPSGLLYQRYDITSDLLVTFETLDPEKHLDIFHDWMNQPRVAEFWELDKSKEELKEYIKTLRADRHSWPVLASLNGEAMGYLEMYWVPEDRLGPYYECDHWDRGSHVLVGNTNFLGARYSKAWTCALSHFLYLDDPRTRTLVGEPRADNKRLLKLLEPASWFFVKEFDFPHKRAALIQCRRDKFFQKVRL